MKKKILIVDDEPSISMLIEFNFKLAGFEVHCVFDGEAVFGAIQSFRPDLIVLDLMLPKMDGLQVCRKLRSQNNLVPIIMLTAMQDLTDKIAGLDNGADDYMTKPFSPLELVSRIQAIHRRIQTLPSTYRRSTNCDRPNLCQSRATRSDDEWRAYRAYTERIRTACFSSANIVEKY